MSELETQHQRGEAQGEAVSASDAHALLQGGYHPALDEQIRMRAYELYRERGDGAGDDMNDWLRAESEVRGQSPANAGDSINEQRLAT